MTSNDYKDKIVLVTGSGRGIGKAIALHFADRGAHLVINYFRNRKPAEATVKEIEELGRQTVLVKANVGEEEGIAHLFDEIESMFGGLDIFISNAASGYNRPVMEQKVKGWDWTMNINARAFLFAAQRAVPLMGKRGGGAMVSISSPGAVRVVPEYVVVGASKAALEAVTRYLAIELAPMNIVVNAVSPGIVDTEALKHFSQSKDRRMLEHLQGSNPGGRLVTGEDVAGVVAFLCSPAADMIRGQVIVMDGGRTLKLDAG